LSFAHERVASAFWLDASTSFIQFGGLGLLIWRHAFSAAHALYALGVATAIPTVVWLVLNRSLFTFVRARLRSDAVLSWKTGRWLVAGVVAHFAAKDLYPWLLEATRNVQTVALFAAASGVAMLINPAITGTQNTLGAAYAREFAERGEVGLRHRVKRDTRIAVYSMIAYVAALAIAGQWLAGTIYGAQYRSSGPLVALIALSLAASVVTMPIGLGLFALDRTRTTFGAVCVAIVVSVVAGIPLAAKFGATGVGIALCLSNAAESIVKVWLYRQQPAALNAPLPMPEELCA
jgi:O-antigen/teichoic acid export membrane protein